ncbi:hypothetical protein BRARA_C03477 [Brassica rapa]|uniref:Uncharacterized protein n=1 Tax=Brassica campestris TaxID=3711 RepID=A0A398A2B2_BRACM|nr:hypothetical protein BRARA_C03477 [Brassica rapa]
MRLIQKVAKRKQNRQTRNRSRSKAIEVLFIRTRKSRSTHRSNMYNKKQKSVVTDDRTAAGHRTRRLFPRVLDLERGLASLNISFDQSNRLLQLTQKLKTLILISLDRRTKRRHLSSTNQRLESKYVSFRFWVLYFSFGF